MSSGMPLANLHLVDRAVRAALAGRAVVGDEDDRCVLSQLADLLQVVEQAADLVVGVGEEPGVDLGHPARTAASRRRTASPTAGWSSSAGNGLPSGPVRVSGVPIGLTGGSSVSGGTMPSLLLPGQRLLADRLVAHVELALELLDPLLRRVVRRVAGARRVVEEERLVRRDRLGVRDELDRLVGDVDGQVVAVLRRASAGRPGGCRRPGRDTTGWSRRRGSRRTARSRARSASCAAVEARFISSSGHRCHLPTM